MIFYSPEHGEYKAIYKEGEMYWRNIILFFPPLNGHISFEEKILEQILFNTYLLCVPNHKNDHYELNK